jgi:hypothetical protein
MPPILLMSTEISKLKNEASLELIRSIKMHSVSKELHNTGYTNFYDEMVVTGLEKIMRLSQG